MSASATALIATAVVSIFPVTIAVVAYRMAQRKGRTGWWALLGLVGLLVLSTLKPVGAAAEAEERALEAEQVGTTECGQCGFYNSPAASECRKCRSPLPGHAELVPE